MPKIKTAEDAKKAVESIVADLNKGSKLLQFALDSEGFTTTVQTVGETTTLQVNAKIVSKVEGLEKDPYVSTENVQLPVTDKLNEDLQSAVKKYLGEGATGTAEGTTLSISAEIVPAGEKKETPNETEEKPAATATAPVETPVVPQSAMEPYAGDIEPTSAAPMV